MLPPSARTRAARDARSTFPQSHARAARCAWQGEVSKTDGQSRRSSHSRAVARLRARIWEEQGDAASGAGGGQQNTCRLHCACRRSSQSEDRGSQCTSSSLLDCVHLESAHAQLRWAPWTSPKNSTAWTFLPRFTRVLGCSQRIETRDNPY